MGYYYSFHLLPAIILIAVVVGVVMGMCAYFILLERKIAAWMQDRIGPNRVGPLGLLQPIADGLKFLLKEQIVPSHVDKVFYFLAPAIAVSTALFALAVVPFGATDAPPNRPWPQTVEEAQQLDAANPDFAPRLEQYNDSVQFVIAPHLDVGVVYVFAVGSLAVYAIILGGWSSNNKYSFLGSLRSSAQFLSYEIPMGMSILGVVLMAGSLNLEQIINQQVQGGNWNVLFQPLAFLIFLTSVFAETNRMPFDLPEAEQELVGGYHTEYSGMKFAMFFLGEYTHMVTTSFVVVILFLGGWHFWPIATLESGPILKVVVIVAKMLLLIVFSMLIRWTIPRFRFDQLMALAWKVFIPLALFNLVCVLLVLHFELSPWWLLPASVLLLIGAGALGLSRRPPPPTARVVYRGHERVVVAVR
jgi:NADH-quinone oxidoreductase subunit H